ncbi:MAG: hypothetical protein R3C02_19065 [Planctomycetaceae bacterium]
MQIVERLDAKVHDTLTAFEQTSLEWKQVASNVQHARRDEAGSLDEVVERATDALVQFAETMETAQVALGSPHNSCSAIELQESLQAAVATAGDGQ